MRTDSHGLFWNDTDYKTEKKEALLAEEGWIQVFSGFWAEEHKANSTDNIRSICMSLDAAYSLARASKTGEKRTPPDPVWLSPDYLPGLQEAREFNIPWLDDDLLVKLSLEYYTTGKRHELVYDFESYGNFMMVGFISVTLGKVFYLELSDDYELNCSKLKWIFENFTTIGFNSNGYDIYIASMAVHGCSTAQMKSATSAIIEDRERGYMLLRQHKVKKLKTDHIDIIEVAPLFASLKIYGGRLHTKKMQDLPFPPDSVLTEPQRAIMRWYCVNDLTNTVELYNKIKKEIKLRIRMGLEYAQDLRSKSDAQIAETVIGSEVGKLNRSRCYKPKIDPGTIYKYKVPDFLEYQSDTMNWALEMVRNAEFEVGESGAVTSPEFMKKKAFRVTINKKTYIIGIGGLHSLDKTEAYHSGPNTALKEKDVTSFYPFIILNQNLFPQHLGPNFLIVYRSIVERRVSAKKAGDKSTADTLKIVINGSFGKFGSKHSILYAPDLLIQTTITGQLSLLMYIEMLELAGINVVSANTDGVVLQYAKDKEIIVEDVTRAWEQKTNFNMEETIYKSLYLRDVNNYIAVKEPSTWKPDAKIGDKVKTKGIFAKPGLSKNPQNEICIQAIKELLLNNTPIEKTIRECRSINKFVNVRTVKGGAVKLYNEGEPGLFLGKAIRWYYAVDMVGDIVYAKSGNKVPKTKGANPIMELPDAFPHDVDYERYENETIKILRNMGY